MNWYRVKYKLPVNDGSKPEICVFKAETAEEATQRLIHYYDQKCHGIYGSPVVESVKVYADWDAVTQSMNAGGVR